MLRRRARLCFLTTLSLGLAACETSGGGQDVGRILGDIAGSTGQTGAGALSQAEITAGLKEALTVGAQRATSRLSAQDGYFADPQVKIPLPGVLGEAQARLQPLGLSAPLDDLQLKVNRAAEKAVPTARQLAVQAVTSMSVSDALGILNGGDTAATDYLRSRTETQLRTAFKPYFQDALAQSGALTALDAAVARYGAGLVTTDSRGWLTENATGAALDGLFYYVAREEAAIRRDPVKRTSELLRRVFGG